MDNQATEMFLGCVYTNNNLCSYYSFKIEKHFKALNKSINQTKLETQRGEEIAFPVIKIYIKMADFKE